jgi:hypothetical protein
MFYLYTTSVHCLTTENMDTSWTLEEDCVVLAGQLEAAARQLHICIIGYVLDSGVYLLLWIVVLVISDF